MRLSVGSVEIDTSSRTVDRAGRAVSVEPKVFDLLLFLISNRDRVVLREELIERIWEGRIVSDDALSTCMKAARRTVGDDGRSQKMVRTVHRRGFQWVGEIRELSEEGGSRRDGNGMATEVGGPIARLLSEKSRLPVERSIAVMPFHDISGVSGQEYFIDGLVEDMITALSRKRSLFVIARNSSFSYKGKAYDVRAVGHDLGVGYILEGAVRKAADRLRITSQLIDARTGAHVWAERFDGTVDDVFALQDTIASQVASLISPAMELAEMQRALRKPTGNLQAYDYYLRGISCFRNYTLEHNARALELFLEATRLDPGFALAWAHAASCITQRKAWRWHDDAAAAESARTFARKALALDRQDPIVLTRAGWALFYVGGEDDAAPLVRRASEIDPNMAEAWAVDGLVRLFLGDAGAIACFERGLRLNPRDPWQWGVYNGLAQAHYMAGRYDEALAWAAKALDDLPGYPPSLRASIAALAMLNRVDEARLALHEYLKADPETRISTLRRSLVFRRKEDFARYAEGLRRAGMAE